MSLCDAFNIVAVNHKDHSYKTKNTIDWKTKTGYLIINIKKIVNGLNPGVSVVRIV